MGKDKLQKLDERIADEYATYMMDHSSEESISYLWAEIEKGLEADSLEGELRVKNATVTLCYSYQDRVSELEHEILHLKND